MRKIYLILITIATTILFSCSTTQTNSSDIEGSWKVYKISYSNSNQFQNINESIVYTFYNGVKNIGNVDIYSESQQQTFKGEYLITNLGTRIEISFTGNSINNYYLESSVGVMKLSSSSSGLKYLLTKE